MATTGQPDWSFRFFDNREKYLLFVPTCNEKQIIAKRIAMDIPASFSVPSTGLATPKCSMPSWSR